MLIQFRPKGTRHLTPPAGALALAGSQAPAPLAVSSSLSPWACLLVLPCSGFRLSPAAARE